MKKMSLTLLSFALAVASSGQTAGTIDTAGLPNASVVKPGLIAAGRPSPEAVASLKARGFRTVIDLRTPTEPGFAEEKEAVEAQGLRYVNVPVAGGAFSGKDVDAVKAALDGAGEGPVLLHCASSNRVGAVWAVLQAREGLSVDEAMKEGARVGLTSPALADAARRVATEGATARP
ncbi:MAG: protein tyrosine phosphatase family protein [Vicinamibacteria bacterium]